MSSDYPLALVNACRTGDLATTLPQLTEALARAVQVPRVGVWQLTEQHRRLHCRHRYLGPGALPTPMTVLSAEHCPHYFAALQTTALIAADDAHHDSRCRELSAGYLTPFGIGAMLVVPLRLSEQLWGALCLEHAGPHQWTAAEQQLAQLAAELLSQQLVRDRLLQEHGRLLALSDMQQSILDGADYAIISTDTDGLILSFNAAATRMLGYRADELVGKQTPALFHDAAEVRQRALELSQQLGEPVLPGFEVFVALSRRGQVEERQWSYIRKDGSRFPVLLSVSPIRRNSGEVSGFLGVAAELTEHQRMRASLRDSEARYQTLFDGTGDSIFLMRGEQFIDCNPATLKMFGCQRDQIIGQPPYRFSPEFQPDGRRSDEKAVEKITAAFSGQTQQFEWLHCQYGGTPFDAEVTLNVVAIGGEPHLLATVRDITARKRTETELAQSRQTLLARNESLRLINRLADRLHGSVELPAILTTTMTALRSLTPQPHVMLCLQEPEQQALTIVASEGFAATALPVGTMPALANALTELVSGQQRWFVSATLATDLETPAPIRTGGQAAGIGAVVVVPLRYRELLLGSIALCYPQPRQFGAIEFDSFVAIGNTVAAAIASARHVDGLEYLAHHDSLTGLPNRMFLHKEFFLRMVAPRISNAAMPNAALMLMDLDRFKEINDTLGHHVGDLLLQQIGPRLKSALADHNGVLCRLGGDEFALLLLPESAQAHSVEQVRAFAQQLLTALRAPYEVNTMQLVVDASIGIAFYPADGDDSHALLRSADVAMYEAKRKGIGIALYDRSQDQNSPERLAMIADLDRAIREQQLCLHFQPKLDLKTGHIAGFEALVRWQHPRLGLLYPDSFLALAEMSETIHPLTERVLDLALAQLRQWQDRALPFSVAVNLSARNLIDDRILQLLQQQIARHGINPALLELEITETALMDEPELAAERLDRIAALGVRIAIDDYGAGYSSLGYLHRLPIHALKIDRMFVRDMFSNEHDTIIVRSTIALAHNLGLQVVAEGVEDSQTQTLLLGMGCDHIQGYHLSRPLPADQLTPFLSR